MALYGKIRFAGVYRLARFTSRIDVSDTPYQVAHDDFAVGEGLMGNRREAPEPYCHALASVPGSRHA